MFDISVEDPVRKANGETDPRSFVYQNSWGLSTRTLGVMVMVHGDDQGLVLPPRVALHQVVIVPVGLSKSEGSNEKIYDACTELEKTLLAGGVRAKADLREGYTPGWKFNDWEMRGIPLRLELGPRDIAAKSTLAVRRYDNKKESIGMDGIAEKVKQYLDDIQTQMFVRAKEVQDTRWVVTTQWDKIVPTLDSKCAVVIPWCEGSECEDEIKAKTKSESVLWDLPYDELTLIGPTRDKRKIRKLQVLEPNPCVFLTTRNDGESSRMERTRSVSTAAKKLQSGPCSVEVSYWE
jgi:prolyl-tRNA synthetase